MRGLALLPLLFALVCGVVWGGGDWLPIINQYVSNEIRSVMYYAAAPAQALGVFLMSRSGKSGWPVVVGYIAAALWVVAIIALSLSGGGAMVIGIIFSLPAIGVAALLQLASLIGFLLRA